MKTAATSETSGGGEPVGVFGGADECCGADEVDGLGALGPLEVHAARAAHAASMMQRTRTLRQTG
jgi:hypothetical protein